MGVSVTVLDETPLAEITASVLSIADKSGDIRHQWDRGNPTEVAIARDAFKQAKDKGMFIYRARRDGSAAERITEFDPDAERIVCMHQLVGG